MNDKIFFKKFLVLVPEKDEYICIINPDACKACFSSYHLNNFRKHVKNIHKEFYENQIKILRENELNSKLKLNVLENYFPEKDNTQIKFLYSISKNEFIDACINLVTLGSKDFSIFNVIGFKKLIQPIMNEIDCVINRQNIKNFIKIKAEAKRNYISKILNSILFSIKIDGL